jgi:hypothetical protein
VGVAEFHPCPRLGAVVELTDERREHVARRQSDLVPGRSRWVGETLSDPDYVVRRIEPLPALLFLRWYDSLGIGKYVAVVVASDEGESVRHWIVTTYMRRHLPAGVIEWRRS